MHDTALPAPAIGVPKHSFVVIGHCGQVGLWLAAQTDGEAERMMVLLQATRAFSMAGIMAEGAQIIHYDPEGFEP